jgi:tripartite-type tricarboxylate transporter receptor subunit TctC
MRTFRVEHPRAHLGHAMTVPRRRFLHLAAAVAASPALSRNAWAESYPARPVHLIIIFPAGSAPDIIGRLAGQWLSDRLGQQFIVENKPGAGGNIATEFVAKAEPDGYTILMPVSTNAVNASLYSNLSFNFVRDIVPIVGIAKTPFVLIVAPSFPAKTFPEFIEYAKANPGKINMASGGVGSTPHVCGELLQIMTGIKLVHVPYRGQYMPDILSGQVQCVFNPIAQSIEMIKNGQLRALAVTTAQRTAALPDVPAIGEFAKDYEAFGWYGLGGPRGIPAKAVSKLEQAMLAAVADPKAKERFDQLGVEPMPLNTAGFAKFVNDEADKWAKVIKTQGIKIN